ncbi:MAG: VOC family protein [Thiohalophilus sp.]|uniref:VOC family protein n=1 Tax=Thiohalophilus sp. TaxID=3028392 RepID=UPI0028700B26|nr:VOC family protein [Thiohalophilus sp.]MDR9435270.1 VOC family protein [Thiohalophilus sp.]
MSNIVSINHVSLIVNDTSSALDFYAQVLGLAVDEARPDLGYPGAWLRIAGQQLHLLELPNPDPVTDRPAHGGRDRHVAFNVNSLDELVSRLEQQNIDYTLSRSGRRALFCRDPDGNALEFIEQTG